MAAIKVVLERSGELVIFGCQLLIFVKGDEKFGQEGRTKIREGVADGDNKKKKSFQSRRNVCASVLLMRNLSRTSTTIKERN